ncbi:universal stress protein [Streptomyces sp. NBC_01294]|uniref:universal stress protein n=1 Tax=Streptomyces sp. NBC_01294 TaxID=2903815 RepID=UPI002DDB7F90|nr:universal stress protein [Streptomyces sp. NBC_01294]WRZ61102.1 universal stress protein [Streptomyces sp. NBC_01294]
MAVGMTHGPELGAVVAGVDGSRSAERAVFWAAAEAVRRDGTLHLVHGADTDSRMLYASMYAIERIRRAGRDLLEETAAKVAERHPGLHVSTELSPHEPVAGLHAAAADSDTIVVGSRGLGGFESLMLGSVGLKVAAGAKAPVVVVRGDENTAEAGVVLAAIRDEHDVECARYAASEAELRRSSLRLLHVWNVLESVAESVTVLDDADEGVQVHVRRVTSVAHRIRDEFPALSLHVDTEKSSSVARVMVEASRHADLLVMGGRRTPGYFGPTLGWATHSLLHHSHCPVELIPRHGKQDDEDQGL